MNGPAIWLGIPAVAGLGLWAVRSERLTAILGGSLTLVLCLMALAIPIDQAFLIAGLSFKISPVYTILGRQFILTSSNQIVLAIIYGAVSLWFFSASVTGIAHRLVPLGLIITALLLGSLAVEPFLYAALLIEMAVLISIPLLVPPDQKPGRGVIRFLVFQTLAMPFILLSGFLLAGVEASPADINLVIQSALLLGLGFAFLLAVFPFYTWIPMLTEESSPYAVGFVLMLFPTIGLLFGLGFLDRYTFLRESRQLYEILRVIGLLTLVIAGIWVMFQRHLGRIMGYAAIIATSMSILAVSRPSAQAGISYVLIMIVPRALGLGVWAMALVIIQRNFPSLVFSDLKGQARNFPFVTAALICAGLSMAGVVPLAGFSTVFSLWTNVGAVSLPAGIWLGIGLLGLVISSLRTLAVLIMAPEKTPWQVSESWLERILLGLGIAAIFLVGLFPQWTQVLLVNLPALFEHLGK
jgi:NADH-quinone oxidoreductase subunit N